MVLRACLDCGEPTPRPRCPTHTRLTEARRPSRRVLGRYDTRYLKLRDIVLREQPWCAMCRTPGTEADPLQVDHITPLARGGRNVRSNMQSLHRSCNAAKRDRVTVTG